MALNILIGLVYTPVMMDLLGQNEYGLYNTVASTIAMLSVLSLGFSSAYIRFFADYKKENNEGAIHRLNGLFIIIFTVIGIVALLCGVFLSFHLEMVFEDGLTSSEYEIARVLMLLLTVNLAVSFPASVFTAIISAHEKFVFLKLLGMLKTVLGPLVTLPLLLAGFRSIAMVSVTVAVSLVTDLLYVFYVVGKLRQRFVFHGFERGLFRRLFVYTGFIAVNLVVDQINWNMGNFLLGRFKGTAAVAVYAAGYQLYSYYMLFSTSVSSVFTPRIHRTVLETKDDIPQQKKRLTELFVKMGRVQFLILGLVASGIVFFGRPFIHFWAGEGYEDTYYVTLLLVLPATVALIQNLGIEIQRAQDKHRFRSFVYLGMALTNLVLSVILCQRLGAVGAAIGTAVSLVIANGIVMNIYYHKQCHIDILLFWKNIARVSVGLILPIAAGIAITHFVDLYSKLSLLLAIVAYSAVYVLSMWLFGMNAYEKELIRKALGKVIGLFGKLFKKLFRRSEKNV